MATNVIGTAFVAIKPDLDGFADDLKTKLEGLQKKQKDYLVPVRATLAKGFRKDLTDQVKAVTSTLRVPAIEVKGTFKVTPPSGSGGGGGARRTSGGSGPTPRDVTALKNASAGLDQIQEKLKNSTLDLAGAKRLDADATKQLESLTKTARAGTSTDAERLDFVIDKNKNLQTQTRQRVADLEAVAKAEGDLAAKESAAAARSESATKQKKAQDESLRTTRERLDAITTKLASDELKRGAALRLQEQAGAIAKDLKSRLAAPDVIDAPQLEFTLARAEDVELQAKTTAATIKQTAETTKLEAAVKKVTDAEKERLRVEQQINAAASEPKLAQRNLEEARAARQAAEAAVRSVKPVNVPDLESRAEVGVEDARRTEALAKGRLGLARVTATLNSVEDAGVGAVSKRAAAEAKAATAGLALKQSKAELKAAILSGIPALEAEARALVVVAEATAVSTAATYEKIKADVAQSRTLGQVNKGLIATSAGFLGLRGAVLAASAPFLIATIALTAVSKAIGLASTLEEQMNVFRETMNATEKEMAAVSRRAIELGRDVTLPGVAAGDAAATMLELAKAGLSVRDAMDGAQGVLQLATAAQIENAQASELAASALNAFGLAGTEATHVADVFTNAANASQGTIVDIAVAGQQVNAVARQVGLSLESTAAILSLFARNGLRGSDAGTSLRTGLIKLISPTRDARAAIESLGLQLRDAEGNLRSDVFAQFGEATANMSPALRDATAALIFGQDAIRGVAIAAREGREGLASMEETLAREGAAADLAAARSEGLGGSIRTLESNIETLATTLTTPLLGALEGAVEGINEIVTAVSAASDAIGNLTGPFVDFIDSIPGLGRPGSQIGKVLQASLGGPSVQALRLFGRGLDALSVSEEEAAQKARDLAREARELRNEMDGTLPRAIRKSVDAIEGFRAERIRIPFGFDREDIAAAARLPDVLRTQLQAAFNAFATAPNLTGDQAQAARAEIDRIVAEMRELGPKGAAALRAAAKQLTGILGPELRGAIGDVTGVDLLDEGITNELKAQIEGLAQVGPEGVGELNKIGKQLGEALAEGLEDSRGDAVKEARQTLRDVIAEGRDAVNESIRTARSGLRSLAEGLSGQVAELIELGPFQDAIKKLEDELTGLQERTQRRSLRFDLSQAQNELADAQQEFRQLSGTTPAQQREIAESLAPFEEKVKDAEAALQEFTLEEQIEQQERLKTAAKEAAEQGIQALVRQFEAGTLSADQFAVKLQTKLKPQMATLKKQGKNLGLFFEEGFLGQVNGLVEQAEALAGFLGVPGTQPGVNVERPGDEVAAQATRRAEAQAALKKASQSQQKTADNTTEIARLMKIIAAASIKADSSKRNTKAGKDLIAQANAALAQGVTKGVGG